MPEASEIAQEDKEVLPGIKRNVFFLGLVSFFNDISSEMLYPLIPIFLTVTLGAPVAAVGFIEGIAEATASLTKGFSGWLSDRFQKRRPLITLGYSLSAIAKPLLGASTGWPMVLGLRFGDRLGKGIRTAARDALIADSSSEKYRGRAFGFHRALDTSGAALGPLLALALLNFMGENLRLVFIVSFIPALLGVLLLIKVRERPRKVSITNGMPNLRLDLFDRRFKLFLVVVLVFSLGNSSDVFLILRAKDLGFSTSLVILAYAFYNVVYALVSTPAGILSDRIGRKWVMGSGFLIFAAVYFGFAVAGHPFLVWGLFAVYGFYMAMTEGVSKAFTVDLVPQNLRGTALGSYHMAVGIMTFPASFLAGLLWTYVSPAAPFALGAAMAVIAA
ncbi:MAG: MFS transporter, partial [Dehalococcoidia bacterium]|nr:MFS transporter [Dehalococcoidia bacterium]